MKDAAGNHNALIKRNMTMRLLALLGGFGWLAGCAAPDAPAPELYGREKVAFPAIGDGLTVDKALITGVLPNGLRYAIYPNDTPPDQASIQLVFEAGSVDEGDDIEGLAHFLEHMAFNGSTNVPEGEMVKILEREGLAFGPDTNAFTSFDMTAYTLELPNVNETTLEAAMFLLAETSDELTLDQGAIDRERGVIESEYRVRVTYQFDAYVAGQEFLVPGLRTTKRLPIGKLDDIAAMGAEEMRTFYEAYYRPEHAMLIVVGAVDGEAIKARIQTHFGDWNSNGDQRAALALEDPGRVDFSRQGETSHFYHPDINNSILISWLKPASPELPPSIEASREQLIDALAGSMVNRRITREIRAGSTAFLGASYFFQDRQAELFDWTGMSLSHTGGEEAARIAARRAAEIYRQAVIGGFTQAELEEQRALFIKFFEDRADEADTRPNTEIAQELRSALIEGEVFESPMNSIVWLREALGSVTLDEAEAALARQSAAGDPLVFVTTPQDNDQIDEAALEGWRDGLKSPVETIEDQGVAAFAYRDFGEAGGISSDTRIEEIDARAMVFDNKVRLTIKPTDFEKDVVRVLVRFGRGLLEPVLPYQQGLADFASRVFIEGGLEAHTRDELQSLFAGEKVLPSLGVESDAFSMFAITDAEDFDDQMALFRAYFDHAAWREEPAERWKRNLEERFRGLKATPQAVWRFYGSNALCVDDRWCAAPDIEIYRAADIDSARTFLDRALREGAIEISVVGDITEEAAIAAVGRSFGTLGPRADRPLAVSHARRFPQGNQAPIIFHHEGEPNRALVALAWRAPDAFDREGARKALLLAEIMSLKATETLRERDGLTYSASVTSTASTLFDDYGYVLARVDVDSAKVEEAMRVMEEIASEMHLGQISEDERQRALKPLLENITNREKLNGYWSNVLADVQTEPFTLERHLTARSDLQAASVEELTILAREIFDPSGTVRIHILPQTSR
jgi:zinc protease